MFMPKPERKSNRGKMNQRLMMRNRGQPRYTRFSSSRSLPDAMRSSCSFSRWKSLGPRYRFRSVDFSPRGSKVQLMCAEYFFRSPVPFSQEELFRVALSNCSGAMRTQLKNWFLKAIHSRGSSMVSDSSPLSERLSVSSFFSLYVSEENCCSKSKPFSCWAATSCQLMVMLSVPGCRTEPIPVACMLIFTR